jgi:hypothetical protein
MERGLYLSFNGGEDWQPFQGTLPIVPVTDLMLRRNDLVIATQGRAFWVVDDIAPLRQYAPAQDSATVHLYAPSPAVRMTPTQGGNSGEPFAPSAPDGALIYYALAEDADLDEHPLTLELVDAGGAVVRTLSTDAKKGVEGGGRATGYALPAERGINRAVWDLRGASITALDYDVVFGAARDEKAIAGYHLPPGSYTVRLRYRDQVQEQPLRVDWDPINAYDSAAIAEQQAFLAEVHGMIDALYRRIGSLQRIQEQLQLRRAIAEAAGDDRVMAAADALLEALRRWQTSVSTPERETFQDVLNYAPRIDAFLSNLYQQADAAVLGLTGGQRRRLDDLRPQWQSAVDAWEQLINGELAAFNAVAGPAVAVPAWERRPGPPSRQP